MIGIISAMEKESKYLTSVLDSPRREEISGIPYTSGVLEGRECVIATCGVGKVFAAICAQTMFLRYAPSMLLNSGVAGTLTPMLKIGDIAVAQKFVQHDMDTSAVGDPPGLVSGIRKIYFPADPDLVQLLQDCARKERCGVQIGCIATGDHFVAEQAEKERIAKRFGAVACEMEGGAIAQVAYVNRIPYAAIRTISDCADGTAPEDYAAFVGEAVARSAGVVRRFLAGLGKDAVFARGRNCF